MGYYAKLLRRWRKSIEVRRRGMGCGLEGEGVGPPRRNTWRRTGKKTKRELFLREKIIVIVINIHNTVFPILFTFWNSF